jgi:hypothetical protein
VSSEQAAIDRDRKLMMQMQVALDAEYAREVQEDLFEEDVMVTVKELDSDSDFEPNHPPDVPDSPPNGSWQSFCLKVKNAVDIDDLIDTDDMDTDDIDWDGIDKGNSCKDSKSSSKGRKGVRKNSFLPNLPDSPTDDFWRTAFSKVSDGTDTDGIDTEKSYEDGESDKKVRNDVKRKSFVPDHPDRPYSPTDEFWSTACLKITDGTGTDGIGTDDVDTEKSCEDVTNDTKGRKGVRKKSFVDAEDAKELFGGTRANRFSGEFEIDTESVVSTPFESGSEGGDESGSESSTEKPGSKAGSDRAEAGSPIKRGSQHGSELGSRHVSPAEKRAWLNLEQGL